MTSGQGRDITARGHGGFPDYAASELGLNVGGVVDVQGMHCR
jgi:hypothetical protein